MERQYSILYTGSNDHAAGRERPTERYLFTHFVFVMSMSQSPQKDIGSPYSP